ncbi:uncharacterized protein I303_106279 [Kwoniella dejecticola CBS 10117]|uniref:JmjC domain-containing protein n=1 Tax=Kwoniella dejecticola CBS 10117 TaxID=1296121 RepID=A0A1A6A1S5_9TREE|nr:uncharacterized protein I303_06298 [Kwoniella dejecticola CBS 10117]OBR84011.1 hypothetical protein I303_06298 [Kwoniella dejecticola CBS 10117]
MSNWPTISVEQQQELGRLIAGNPPREIPIYDELSYQDFLYNHLIPNQPFILSPVSTSTWSASSNFRIPIPSSTVSTPNLAALRRYAHHVVPVANTLQQQFSEFERIERPLGEVLDLWERGEGNGLYVKDWHLMAEIERDGRGVEEVYEVPECLRDDWLNPPYTPDSRLPTSDEGKFYASTSTSTSTSDFRFTYLGPPLTYTPLHRDVYGSYSWSANVVGRKVWWLFPPDRLDRVKDKNGDLVFDVREIEGEGGAIEILQQEGEIIFVPSGWHHQVVNLDFCISINHNFFSSPSLTRIYDTLCTAQERVEEAISDVKDMIIDRLGSGGDAWEKEWIEEVQGLLERDAGWGWKGFWETVRKKVEMPPAKDSLSPPVEMRNKWMNDIIGKYKMRREWMYLEEVHQIVADIEISITSQNT